MNAPAQRIRRAAAGAFTCALVLLSPGTAWAHGAEGLEVSDYRVSVTDGPGIPGVSVQAVEIGWRLEIVNSGRRNVEILGYSGEPYAEVRPDGVYVNTNSPAAYLNESASASTAPDHADPGLSPRWSRASSQPVFRWHDHRAAWMNSTPPPGVRADPAQDQEVSQWTIPLRVGNDRHEVTGTVDWVAPPQTPTWLAGGLLGAAAVTALSRRWPQISVLLLGTGGIVAVAEALGRAATAADPQTGWFAVLLSYQGWPFFAGAGSVAAVGYALAHRPGSDLALGIAAMCLALLSGLSNVDALSHALTPTPWPGDISRTAVTYTLATGTGITLATLLTWKNINAKEPLPR